MTTIAVPETVLKPALILVMALDSRDMKCFPAGLLFILAGMAACPIRNQAAIPVKFCLYKADYL